MLSPLLGKLSTVYNMVKTAYTCTTNMKSNTMEKKHHELNMVKTAYTCTTNMKSNTMEKKHHEQNMATTHV
jgi:hypothetical protein